MITDSSIDQAIQLHQAGRLRDAEIIYRQILSTNPNQPDALHLLGVIAFECNQPALALGLIRRAIAVQPTSADFHSNLGRVLESVGQIEPAMQAFGQAIARNPRDAENYNRLGILLHKSRRFGEAIQAYQQALVLTPNSADIHNNLGTALWESGQAEQGIAMLRKAVELRPDYPEAHNNLGNALQVAGQIDQALIQYQTALAQRPNYPSVYNNLGGIYRAQGRLDQSIEALTRAIALRPDYADAHNGLGVALLETGRIDEAVAAHRHAIALAPDLAEAHQNLGIDLLLQGDFEHGWPEYEWRWRTNEWNFPRRKFTQPLWNGEDLAGRRILLHAEQGFGDTIQFIRYLPQVAARGGRIMLACHKILVRLLKQLHPIEQFITEGDPVPQFDVHCPLLNLPGIFKTDLKSIPNQVPYLRADPELISNLKSEILNSPFPRVGLVWAGRPTHKRDRSRSIRLEMLARLAQIKGASFFSLQKGESANELPAFPGLIDLGTKLTDFADTAAAMANLDLLITVDTAAAHLAGAMGKPVWVLLSYIPDWRWMLGREGSPWYPTMKMFRQAVLGDWETPIKRLTGELDAFAGQRG